jgi:hypothetical protein
MSADFVLPSVASAKIEFSSEEESGNQGVPT